MIDKNPATPRFAPERITVGLTRQNSEDLTRLSEESGMTKTDVLNRALGLYTLTSAKTGAGFKLGFIGADEGNGSPAIEIVHIL